MNYRRTGFLIFFLLLFAVTPLFAQVQTGNIFGTVRATDGSALPGVTVTLTGVGAPQTFVTDGQGNFRFLNLSPGTYTVKSELAGFGTTTRSGVGMSIGRNAELDIELNPSVTEAITITAEAPLLDTRKTGTGATLTKVELESVPTARDPWVVLQQAPGVQMDRVNIGGNESGQQSNYVSKGTNSSQATWNVDGVNITDVGALGSSPTYYDFDAFEEMQVTTGGTDVRIQTPGVQLNMVTKRGTNDFSGSGRFMHTSGDLQANPQIPDEATAYLARLNEINKVDDYGVEVGGPILRDRLWLWGAFSKQEINLFTAQRVSQLDQYPDPFRDDTELETLNGKLNAQLLANNSLAAAYTKGNKIKLGRNVGPDRPPETGFNQDGPTDVWKIEDTHIFGSNFYITGLYSRVESVFQLIGDQGNGCTSLECGLNASQSWYDAGLVPHRSFVNYLTERPQDQFRADGSTFFSTGSINHELKFGIGFRDAEVSSFSAWPGGSAYTYMYDNDELEAGATGLAFFLRDTDFTYDVEQTDFYVGDTMLLGNLTIQAGARFDRQLGSVRSGIARENPIIPEFMPTTQYNGAEIGEIEWSTVSPRLGLTYALGADKKTLLRAAANRYVDNLGGAAVYSAAISAYQYSYFYFTDVNGDGQVQRAEIDFDTGLVGFVGFDPNDPHAQTARYDNNMKAPQTDELILGFERELFPDFVIGVNGTYRRLSNFTGFRYEWNRGQNDFVSPDDYELIDHVSGTLPDGTAYADVPVYGLSTRPIYRVITDLPGYSQTYKGLDLSATKRMANRWMMRGSFSWNDWTQNISEEGLVDPTRQRTATGCSNCDGGTVVSGSGAGSGAKGGIYMNAEWQYSLTGAYQIPVIETSLGFSLNGRQGYPVPYVHRVYVASEAIYKQVLPTEDVDTYRLPDIHNLDLRLAKDLRFRGLGLTVSADVFNVLNENTELQRFTRLNNVRKNEITETQSPRVFRVGARFTF
ncbi:MAG: carboxypeptidase regulatory-like domain-containing protein [Thermoanaerobaculia bacterium]